MNKDIRELSCIEVLDLPIELLDPAPINVHAVESADDPEFVGLVESIRSNGIINRIIVREGEDGRRTIIDGHRRFYAAKAAGLLTIPVEVLDADEAKAAILTVATNVQRRSNDPLLEAELIAWLRKNGLSIEEVASELGKSAHYVAIRAKLTDLTPAWRTLATKCRCTTDLLLKVARHTQELQNEVADAAQIEDYEDEGDELSWDYFEHLFASRMLRIASARFDTTPCKTCQNNTGIQELLFVDETDGNARCECASCYIRKNNEAVDQLIDSLRNAGTPAIEVMSRYYIPNSWEAKNERDDNHPQAYVFKDGDLRCIAWSVPKEGKKTDAKTAEERKAAREERKAAKALAATHESVRTSVNDAIRNASERLPTIFGRIARSDGFAKWAEKAMMKQYVGGCEYFTKALELIEKCGGPEAFGRAFCTSFSSEQIKAIGNENGEEGEV